MRRADRLFDIIQALRPATGAAIMDAPERAFRTVYRDIGGLQVRQVPVGGARRIGDALREGPDLPPLMFTADIRHFQAGRVENRDQIGDRIAERGRALTAQLFAQLVSQ